MDGQTDMLWRNRQTCYGATNRHNIYGRTDKQRHVMGGQTDYNNLLLL